MCRIFGTAVTCDLVVVDGGEDKTQVNIPNDTMGAESQMVDNLGNVYRVRDCRLGKSQGPPGIPVISGIPISLRVAIENVTPDAVSIAKLTLTLGYRSGDQQWHDSTVEFRGVPLSR